MRRTKSNVRNFHDANFLKFAAVAFILLTLFPGRAVAQQKDQKTFASAQEASDALVAAIKSGDEAAMLAILGSDGKDIISSGDPAEDKEQAPRCTSARRIGLRPYHCCKKDLSGISILLRA
jgi:hypothetical protein